MIKNTDNVSGVFHHQKSEKHYQLRRYLPETTLASLIEQFWFVDWALPKKKTHQQQNLPDPNFHLVIVNNQIKILGPIDKVYRYTMMNCGQIIGVKFNSAALKPFLDKPIKNYINSTLALSDVFNINESLLMNTLKKNQTDVDKVATLTTLLLPYAIEVNTDEVKQAKRIIHAIKSNPTLSTVEQLASQLSLSVRTIQRYSLAYIGFTPKWLIRKYRLHQALSAIEEQEKNINDIVEWLGYTDQSHLIRDFKNILGITPKKYLHLSQ